MLPFYLRAKGTTIYQCWQGLVLVYNGFVNPVAMDAIDWRYYIVFCCLLAFELTVIYFSFPEVRATHFSFLCHLGRRYFVLSTHANPFFQQTFGMTLEETSQVFGDGALDSHHIPGEADNKADGVPGATHVDGGVGVGADEIQEKRAGTTGN